MVADDETPPAGPPETGPETAGSDLAETAPIVAPSGSKVPTWVIKAIVLFWTGWLAVFYGTGALRSLRSLLIVILISLFLSFAIEPAVNRLERWGFRRGVGVWMVYLGLMVSLVAFSAAIGTALATQLQSFIDEAPRYVEDIEGWLQDNVDDEIDLQSLREEFVDGGGVSDLAGRFADDILNLGTTVVNVIFQTFTVLLFVFYLVAEGPQLRRTVCSFLAPERQRVVLSVWDLAIEKTGSYIYSRGILALASSVVHWIAFTIIGVPFPVPLAIWLGVMSQFIPVVGTYIAGALPLLVALLDEPKKGVAVLSVVFVYQQLENYGLAPRVTAHTMQVHVAVAFGSVLAGAALLGVVGALLALPFAATVQAFVAGYRQHHDVEEQTLSDSAARRGRT